MLEMRPRRFPTRSLGAPTTRLIFIVALLVLLAPLHSSSSSSAVHVAAFSFETASDPATQRQQRPSEPSRPPPTIIPENEDLLREMQAKHREVAETFVPSKFDPLPGFGNPHLQTIGGVFLRKSEGCSYVSEPGLAGITQILKAVASIDNYARDEDVCDYWDRRVRVETQCGADFFHADVKYAGSKPSSTWQSEDSKGTIVLIHGLESNSNSSLSTDMANAYQTDGFDVICLNFRGCCGTPNLTLGGYHLGFTDDLRHFLEVLKETWENHEADERPIYLSGFSLGANVVLKTLGELGETAMTKYNVQGASVTGAPYDLERNINCIDAPGFNRAVYSNNFLKTLKKRAQYQLDVHCEGNPLTTAFDYARVMKATAIADFDDSFIAPVYGFESNIDYYRQSSCVYFLDSIAVPTFIINAGDDPFFDPTFHPIDKSVDGGGKAPIKMVRTKFGGHLGYLFHRLSDAEKKEKRTSSWMPTELARFVSHIHNYDYAH